MERFPTKLKDAFKLIRMGKIDAGLKMMDEVKGLEHKKNIALAELAYFRHDWAKGLELSCSFLPDMEACHYSNIYDEHFAMIVLASHHTGEWGKTEKFLKDLLKGYEKLPKNKQPQQRLFQIREKLGMIKNRAKTVKSFSQKPKERTKGRSLEEITAQLKEVKRMQNKKPIEKAEYILYFLHFDGKTKDFLKLYEQYGEKLDSEHHERAAKEYLAVGDMKKAQQALLTYAKKWWPIEHMQVEPVILMTQNELLPALTKDLCLKIIKTPKGN